MNKIYKVIWSKVRNCYVVVSELAKRNGKNAATTDKRRKMTTALALSAMAVLLNLGTVAGVEAGVIVHTWDGFGSLIQSGNSHATGGHALAIGQDVGNAAGYRSLVWGQNTNTIDGATNSTAFGENTKTTARNSIAYGLYARSLGAQASAWGENTVAGGIYYRNDSDKYDKLGYIDYNFNNNGTIRKAFIYLDGTAPDILNDEAVSNIEKRIYTTAKNATAFGQKTVAYGVNSTAFGFKTQATDENATAWGHETKATDKRATAFGIQTTASGRNSTSFGYSTTASGENATAFGSGTVASGGGATSWGTGTKANAEASTSWGMKSEVYGGTFEGGKDVDGEIYGDVGVSYYNVEVLRVAAGQDTSKYGDVGTHYIEGTYKDTDGKEQKKVIKNNIGSATDTQTGRAEADRWLEENGGLGGRYATAFGNESKTYAINSLAALGGIVGQEGKNYGKNSAAIGEKAEVQSNNAYAIGNMATIGTDSAGSVALGGQDVDGMRTTIGTGATNSFAAIGGMVGKDATNAIAIGGSVSASAVSAIAIGQGSDAVQSRATALGQGATASLENATALGTGATASLKDSVALGSSTTTQAGVVATTGTVGGISYGVWANTLADTNKVVSVGNRQINQVAAGQVSTTSTDAVNGSQLYAAYDQLQWNIVTSGNEKGTRLDHTIGKLTPTGTRQNLELNAGTGITFNSTAAENANRIVEIRSNFDTATLGSDGKIKSITYFDGTEYVTKEIGGGYGIFDANEGGPKTNQFGSTISVVGEGTKPISEYSGKNVKTVIHQDPSGNSTITVKIDENPSFTSVTTGDTKIDTNGLTISNVGPFGNVTITKTNIAMGGNQIHNVAPGTSDTDAVNMSQLNDLIGGGSGKYGLRVGDTTGTTIGQSLNNNVFSVKGGEGTEVPATPSGYSARNITTRLVPDGSGNNSIYIQMSEAPEFKGSTGKSVKISGPEGSVTASNGAQTSMITPEGLTISGAQPIVIQQGNVDVGGNQIHNVARGTAGTDGVNVSQLNDVKWNIGTGAVNGGTNKHGGPLDLSPVGKQDGIDRSNIRFNAGAGVDISYSTILTGTSKDDKEIGYNIDISAKFQDATISFDDSGHYIQAITYEGKKYLLAGGGSGTAAPTDVISDNRAVTAELLEHYNEDIKGYEYAIEVESPFMNLNGLKDEKGKPAEIHTDDFAYAKGENAIAIGRQAEAEADNSLAVGHNADAKAENATAIGMNSHAHAENSVSIGVAASSSGNRAIVIGTTASYDSSREDPANATLPHQGSRASGQGSVVLGDHARAQSEIYTLEIAKNLDLIGTPDHLTNDAIAIGTKAEVRATNAIALGGSMSYTDENGVTKYGETNGRYVGAIVGGSAKSGIAIGGAYGEQGENGEIKQEISAAATYGLRGIAIGTGATVANKDDFTALENVLSNPEYQKAKGDFQKARAEYLDKLSTYDAIKDVPLNDPTVPSGMQITQEDKDRAEYQMNQAKAALEKATQTYSLELKKSIRLQEKDAIEESDAIAIGTKAVAQVKESIALGSNSVTTAKDRAGSRTGLSGYDPLQQDSDNDYFRGDEKYKEDDPVWRSTAGSLSVGGGTTTVKDVYGNEKEVTVTRRISNVAAGIEDSDAVNVAQLKRATSLKTDSRNTSIGLDKDGNMVVNSPYLNIQGVKTSSDYTTIINRFGTPKEYIQSLEGQKTEINSRIDSINVSREMIKDSLQKLEDDYKAQKITEAAYLAQKADYEEQWDATGRRLDDLAASLKEKDTEIANAPTHYQEAKEYYDSQANASGTDSIAVGNKSVAGGKESVSIGANNTIGTPGELNAAPDAELEKAGQQSIAIGSGNTVMGKKSMAIGTDNTVTGDRSGAIGDPNVIDASDSYSVGNDNKIAAGQNNVFALGNQVTTTTSNSVFLGSNSAYVADGKTTAGMLEYSSATINGRTYNYAGGKPAGVVSVGDEGKERRIQNVAAGKVSADSTDAINGSQLYSALDNVNNSFTNLGDQISNVDNRTRKGIAGAAALAALHPMDFDPDDKLTFAAGMGHYRGESAAALGMFYRPDEKVMFSVGGTLGNGENMINAGVSFSLDRTPRVTGSRTALTKEVVQLREHVAKQDAQIAELTALVRQLAGNAGLQVPASSALSTEGPALFADNLDNKWVYDAIEDLEQRGYFNGYAGRALTRQQIAAALDMAMSGGAKLDKRIVKEFEPELSHVRVAHVEGKGNEEGEWYERPRASHDKYEDKHKIEKKPFRVEEKKVTSKS